MGLKQTTLAEGGTPPGGSRRFLLVVGEGHLRTYRLEDGKTLLIGRDDDADVPLSHPKISRRHAQLAAGPPVVVEDLASTNGIRINGERVRKWTKATLLPGETLQIGPFAAVILDAPRDATADGPLHAAISVADPTPRGVPEVVARVAQGGVSVLITGETGVGKEVLARTVHQVSGRAGQFVAINCAALAENLLESELFGYERGAFTGAAAVKPGLFEVAAGGTVFLDEIGDLPGALQAKLLRALETREVYRLGGVKPVALDARFVSATNRDLAADVANRRFRRDLYYRVNGITLTITPLRERRDAIPALATELLSAAAPPGRNPPVLSAKAVAALMQYDWPGNVRELRTVMERALVIADGHEIKATHILFDRLRAEQVVAPPPASEESIGEAALATAAATHRGNVTNIARALGTSRSQVRRLAKRYGIDFGSYR